MEKQLELFTQALQLAAELAGKDFDPATCTEQEIMQLYELYINGKTSLVVFAREHL